MSTFRTVLVLFCSILCYFAAAQANEKTEFFDFGFILVGVNQDEIETYRFETFSRKHAADNSWGYIYKNDSLRYTEAVYEDGKIVRYDTLNVLLTDEELSDLYMLSAKNFEIDINETFYEIPPPPKPGGITTHLVLDLNFRGGKYHKTIKNLLYGGQNESEFKDLTSWLVGLVVKSNN